MQPPAPIPPRTRARPSTPGPDTEQPRHSHGGNSSQNQISSSPPSTAPPPPPCPITATAPPPLHQTQHSTPPSSTLAASDHRTARFSTSTSKPKTNALSRFSYGSRPYSSPPRARGRRRRRLRVGRRRAERTTSERRRLRGECARPRRQESGGGEDVAGSPEEGEQGR
ncbi:uncharacterized protein A4U43_C02F18920 [Asparagus officinalis]|uniref:Uncharacterized protein n=1 Tax=Asparagus officinalis TaxID=4686 RepID=A0A5P1FP32_ASPOF|nr:uncharacterized protein A4U43_C02F18920 [Asparagus officinalis]